MNSRKAQPKSAIAAGPRKTWRGHLPVLAGLWALALAAYASSFGAGLVFDNRFAILGDPRIHAATMQNAALILGRDYWYGQWASSLYRPLTTFSYLFNYVVLGNGPDPAGYHWINFALHAVNMALVYLLARWIFGEMRSAAALTAVWEVHPVLTESITNVVGRADLLAAFGILAALVCHIQAERAVGGRKARWLAALALATAVGVFSKESGIVAPGVLVLYDLAFRGRGWDAWRARLANYAAAALPCLLFLYVRGRVLGPLLAAPIPFTDNPLTGAGFGAARLTALGVIGKYVGLLFWPGRLSADYSYNQIPLIHAGDLGALAGVAVCIGVAAVGIGAFFRNKPVFFFVGLFFVALAPVCNVFLKIGTIMAERFLYLPALGFAGCAVAGLRAAAGRLPARAAPVLLAAICAAFAIRTYVRNVDWATERSIMASAAESAPDAYRPETMLATLLSGDAAVAAAGRTRAILDSLPDDRNNAQAYVHVGVCYRTEGDRVASKSPGEGERWYQKSLDALLRAQSIGKGSGGTSQRGGFVSDDIYLELGRTYLRLSQPREALGEIQQGRRLTLRPEFFYEEISNAYRAMGDTRQAAIALIEAVEMNDSETKLNADSVNAYKTLLSGKLMDLYRETEPGGCAVRETRGMRVIDMDCPLVKEQICAAARDLSREYATKGMPAGCPAE